MQISRALKIRDRAIMQTRDLYSSAKMCGMPNADLIAQTGKIRERMKGAPQWVFSYVEGYARALMDFAYRHDLVFGGFMGDVFYSTHRNRPDYYEKNGIEPSAYADDGAVKNRGHYWILPTGPRPFFISAP